MTDQTNEPKILRFKETGSNESHVQVQENFHQTQESNVLSNRRVSFGTFMDITAKKDQEEEDDFGGLDSNPCFHDKNLQIFSFVTLLALITFAIGVFALSQQPKGTENKLFNPVWHGG